MLDDGIPVTPGTQYLFFLRQANDDRYYPLAGHAIAPRDGDQYKLSTATTGTAPLDITEEELEGLEGGGGGGGMTPTISAPRRVTGIRTVTVKGTADPGAEVTLSAKPHRRGPFTRQGTSTADAQGKYRFRQRISSRVDWQVTTPGAPPSVVISTRVRIRVGLQLKRLAPGRARVRMVLSPRLKRHPLRLILVRKHSRTLLKRVRTGRRGAKIVVVSGLPRRVVRIEIFTPRFPGLDAGVKRGRVDLR